MAPRPHNSGHHTIESCLTSQYEQHLRAVVGLPLGDTSMKTPAAIMYNILGEDEVIVLYTFFVSCSIINNNNAMYGGLAALCIVFVGVRMNFLTFM